MVSKILFKPDVQSGPGMCNFREKVIILMRSLSKAAADNVGRGTLQTKEISFGCQKRHLHSFGGGENLGLFR